MLVVGDTLLRDIEALICWPENRTFFDYCSLFRRDAIYFSGSRRTIFGSRLENLVSLALNRKTLGVEPKVATPVPLQQAME